MSDDQPPSKKSRRVLQRIRAQLESPSTPTLPQSPLLPQVPLPVACSQDVDSFGLTIAIPVPCPSNVVVPSFTPLSDLSESLQDTNINVAPGIENYHVCDLTASTSSHVPFPRTPVLVPPVNFQLVYYPCVTSTTTIPPLHEGFSLNWECFVNVPMTHAPESDSIEATPTFPINFCMETTDGDAEPVPDSPGIQNGSLEDKLYEGSTLSLYDSLVSILAFSQSAHLSGADFCKLLDLINLLLPKPSKLPTSKHKFFNHFKNEDTEMQLVHYCNICWKFREHMRDVCTCKGSRTKYFIKCSIESQLRKMFKRPGFVDKLRHRHSRMKVDPENIEDIYDTSVYKTAAENLLLNDLCISLTWYTDGVALYECSSYSLWPFMFVINELPLSERFKPENLILGGLWGDGEKPHPNVFLLPMYEELSKLKKGFNVQLHQCEEETEAKAFVITGTCDVPAKACFMCMKGHSGYCSCPKCFIEGEKSARTSNVMVFPHQEELELRNDENYRDCLDKCVASKKEYLGVNGPSLLSNILSSSFTDSMCIDSMHCVFIGCTKQLLNLWFSPTYSSEPFSLASKTDEVNFLLRNLKLPHFVQRLPEDVTKLGFWKASLCRNFILYIVLPLLLGVMKPQYFNNLSMLVQALALLNKSSISPEELIEADLKLKSFCRDFERLYGVRHMSSNVHLLRHLSASVQLTGNLFISSCFRFEDLNGKLAALAHGTRHATMQIFSNFSVLTELPLHVSKVFSTNAKIFCESLLNHRSNFLCCEKISSGTYVVGDFDAYQNCLDFLQQNFPDPLSIRTFSRLCKEKQLFVSKTYQKGSRESSYCCYLSDNNIQCHGRILTFVKSTNNGFSEYFAVLSRSLSSPAPFARYSYFSASAFTDLVPVSKLLCVSFCLAIKEKMYLVDPLNSFEME